MYHCSLSPDFLKPEEQARFNAHLEQLGLDDSIWPVFESMFQAATGHTQPLLLRVEGPGGLAGAAIIIKSNKYGRALFSNPLLARLIDLNQVPSYLWIRFGCCMDMMSNPGFVADLSREDEISAAMVDYLSRHTLSTIITDFAANAGRYPRATALPALPYAAIVTAGMEGIGDYTRNFKNLKRKIKRFQNAGGEYHLIKDRLDEKMVEGLKTCFVATAKNSVMYLSYQDLYLASALRTSQIELENVYYFVATLNGEFLGYQAAIKTGKFLNALHGAFNRNLKTTLHAYDILFMKMTEFAISEGCELIDYGLVLNDTKQRMVNHTQEMRYFILSKSRFIRWFFSNLLKVTKIQGAEQLKYLE